MRGKMKKTNVCQPSRHLLSVLISVAWLFGCNSAKEAASNLWEDTPNLCRDGIDNDKDGKKDCRDPECKNLYVCQGDGGDDSDSDTDSMQDIDLWERVISNNLVFGSNEGDPSLAPEHTVLVRTYQIMRTEVTVAMYQECIDAGACSELSPDSYCASKEYQSYIESNPGNYPMNCVSWQQAADFCEWFGARLPSEKEWEKAARGSTPVPYPWGEDETTCELAIIDDGTEGPGCGRGGPWPVCSRDYLNLGHRMCDMIGNVQEWVEDDIHPDYHGTPDNGVAWVDSPRTEGRMVRGGAYYHGPEITAQTRLKCDPSEDCDIASEMDGYGFRCAK